MTRSLSVYLDLVRFLAAAMVMIAHLGLWGLSDEPLLPASGRDAVVIFFVLSGFVISYSTSRCHDFKSYAISRSARIYSVALPVLVLALVIDHLGMSMSTAPYEQFYEYERWWLYAPFALTFAGEWWFLSEQPFSIGPWWSLGYEVWYYILFAALTFLHGRTRWIVVGGLLLTIGFKLWLLMPVWFAGVWLHRHIDRIRVPKAWARALVIGTIGSYLCFKIFFDHIFREAPNILLFGTYDESPLRSAKQFLADFFVGTIFVVHLIGWRHSGWALPAWIARPAVWLAGFTFTLYLFHPIALKFLAATGIVDPSDRMHEVMVIAAVLGLSIAIGYLTERRKRSWARLLGGCWDKAEAALRAVRRPAIWPIGLKPLGATSPAGDGRAPPGGD